MQDAGCRMKPQSYSDLEIYVLAKELAVRVHKMTLEELPKFEMYEEGGQISVPQNQSCQLLLRDTGEDAIRMILCYF